MLFEPRFGKGFAVESNHRILTDGAPQPMKLYSYPLSDVYLTILKCFSLEVVCLEGGN